MQFLLSPTRWLGCWNKQQLGHIQGFVSNKIGFRYLLIFMIPYMFLSYISFTYQIKVFFLNIFYFCNCSSIFSVKVCCYFSVSVLKNKVLNKFFPTDVSQNLTNIYLKSITNICDFKEFHSHEQGSLKVILRKFAVFSNNFYKHENNTTYSGTYKQHILLDINQGVWNYNIV